MQLNWKFRVKKMTKNIIVSVESRKGGVGKTTAALCVSKIFLEKGYSVLLIDTDITGTNIADCVDSPFWKNHLNIVNTNENSDTHYANLLILFENHFMNGKKIPSFQTKAKKGSFQIDLEKINVLGSQIYSAEGKPTTICNPAVLFDQLHGYWFVEFIQDLVADFIGNTIDKPIAIILDNSPGYVGIAPAIQDWLTNLGPEIGKFLLITSLDNQDLQSCAMAISLIHEQLSEKFNTSQMFLVAKSEGGGDQDFSLMKGDFFTKLIDYEEFPEKISKSYPAPFAFYVQQNSLGKNYIESPEKYIGVVVNRVPRTVLKNKSIYQPKIVRHSSILWKLLGGNNSKNWTKFMVGFDPFIEHHFFQSGMRKKRSGRITRANLENLFNKNLNQFNENKISKSGSIFPEFSIFINNSLTQFQEIIDTALKDLRKNGFDHIADMIDEDWQPKSIVSNFRNSFNLFLDEFDYPYYEEIFWEEEYKREILEEMELFNLEKLIKRIDVPFFSERIEIRNIILFLISSLPLSFSGKLQRKLEIELKELFQALTEFEVRFLADIPPKRQNLPHLLSSKINNLNYEKFLKIHRFFDKFGLHGRKNALIDFYHAFTSAQARLMTLSEDTKFLIWLMQTLVDFEAKGPNFVPYIKKIGDEVILHKALSYDKARDKSKSAFAEMQYFIDFDNALREIVKCWELKN